MTPDESVLYPEFIVTSARHGSAILHGLLAPAPLGVHRPGLYARDHADVTLRRTRQRAGNLTAHRLASASDPLAEIVRRIFVIQEGEALEIAGVERLKPLSDDVEGIDQHAFEYFTCMKAHTKYLTLNILQNGLSQHTRRWMRQCAKAVFKRPGAREHDAHHGVGVHQRQRARLHHDFGKWLEELALNPDPDHYHPNRTGEIRRCALKRQIMGREVVVAITKGSSTRKWSRSSTVSSTGAGTRRCSSK